MKMVGAHEAQTNLSRLLEEVEQGETITITRHGVPVAVLTPPGSRRATDIDTLIEEFRRYRDEQDIRLGGLSIKEMIEEGRP